MVASLKFKTENASTNANEGLLFPVDFDLTMAVWWHRAGITTFKLPESSLVPT